MSGSRTSSSEGDARFERLRVRPDRLPGSSPAGPRSQSPPAPPRARGARAAAEPDQPGAGRQQERRQEQDPELGDLAQVLAEVQGDQGRRAWPKRWSGTDREGAQAPTRHQTTAGRPSPTANSTGIQGQPTPDTSSDIPHRDRAWFLRFHHQIGQTGRPASITQPRSREGEEAGPAARISPGFRVGDRVRRRSGPTISPTGKNASVKKCPTRAPRHRRASRPTPENPPTRGPTARPRRPGPGPKSERIGRVGTGWNRLAAGTSGQSAAAAQAAERGAQAPQQVERDHRPAAR